jgi:hypothetical protein
MKINKLITICVIFLLQLISCCKEEENNELKQAEGYIVGFDNCTIRHQYKIGYVIVTSDLKDTLITHNLSDSIYTMPANVFLYKTDTLYQIPWEYFQDFVNSAYLPIETRYNYSIKITYTLATEEEKVFHLCAHDIFTAQFRKAIQVIIKTATKPN